MTNYEYVQNKIEEQAALLAEGKLTPFGVLCVRAEIGLLRKHRDNMTVEYAAAEHREGPSFLPAKEIEE